MTLADPRHAAFYEVIWIIWKRTKLHPQPAPVFLKQWGFAQKSGRTKIGDWFSGAFGYITFNMLSQKVGLKKAEKHGKGIIPLMRVLSTFAQLPGRRGRVLDQYLGMGEPLRVWTPTLFRKTSSISVPCLGQLPQFYYSILLLEHTWAKLYHLFRTDSWTRAKLYHQFRTEKTKTIPCPAAHPRIVDIRE